MSAEKNEQLITAALRVAAEQYARDARATSTTPRLAESFTQQAHDCCQLADKIDESGLDQVAYL